MFSLTVKGVRRIARQFWLTSMDQNELQIFTSPPSQLGEVSMLMVEDPYYDEAAATLTFPLKSAQLINVGTTSELLIGRYRNTNKTDYNKMSRPNRSLGGDAAFLHELELLPSEVKRLGVKLLQKIREKNPGKLERAQTGKYVERPDNFWTIKVQPRDKSLAITVRGEPHYFGERDKVVIKADRGSYSRFKINKLDQIEEAASIILNARRK